MTSDEKEILRERVNEFADWLSRVSKAYNSLRYQANEDAQDEEFIKLVEAAGRLTASQLEPTAYMLEMLWKIGRTLEKEA